MKRWRTTVNVNLSFSQISSPSSQPSARRRQWSSVSESAVNQDAPINKNSKSSNSKSLKQHTLAEPISPCCFCSVRDIGRFTILICRYFRDQGSQQDFQQGSHSRRIYLSFFFSHISCFRIYLSTPTASAMEFSASAMVKQVSESSPMNFFAMPTGRRNGYSLRDEAWRREGDSVTSMPWEKSRLGFILSFTKG